jgi:hypothetical protein
MRRGADVPTGPPRLLASLRVAVAAALVTSAVIHLQLASGYQQGAPTGIGQGNLFRLHAAAAVVAAAWVLIRGSRPAWLAAAAVAFAALAAVVLYRYVPIPAVGPLPAMYEPVWYPAKTVSAIAEGAAVTFALAAWFLTDTCRRKKIRQHSNPAGPTVPK